MFRWGCSIKLYLVLLSNTDLRRNWFLKKNQNIISKYSWSNTIRTDIDTKWKKNSNMKIRNWEIDIFKIRNIFFSFFYPFMTMHSYRIQDIRYRKCGLNENHQASHKELNINWNRSQHSSLINLCESGKTSSERKKTQHTYTNESRKAQRRIVKGINCRVNGGVLERPC